MTAKWFYRIEKTEIGPVSFGGLRQQVVGGTVLPTTPVRQGVDGPWIEAKHVGGLFEPHDGSDLSVPHEFADTVPDSPDALEPDQPAVAEPHRSPPSTADHSQPLCDPPLSEEAAAFDPYHTWLGIPPDQQPPNHYRLLGIRAFEGHPDVIENAADRQMAHLRTRQVGRHSAWSQKLLNDVAAAKICLLTPDKKAAYDGPLRQAPNSQSPGPLAALGNLWFAYGKLIGAVAAGCLLLATTVVMIRAFDAETAGGDSVGDHPKTVGGDSVGDRHGKPASIADGVASHKRPSERSGATPPPPAEHTAPSPIPTPDPAAPSPEPAPDPTLPPEPAPDPDPPPPDPTPPSPEPTEPPAAPEPPPSNYPIEQMRLAEMREIFDRQLTLYAQWQERRRALKGPQDRLNELQRRRVATIGLRGETEVAAAAILDALRATGGDPRTSPRLAALHGQIDDIDRGIRELNRNLTNVQVQVRQAEAEMLQPIEASDRLAPRWLALCDPFGRWGAAVHRRAIDHFSEWIAEENALPMPYLARGFAHLHTAKYDQATADFDRVVQYDPRTEPLIAAIHGYACGLQRRRDEARARFVDAMELVTAARQVRPSPRQETVRLDKVMGLIYVFRGYSFLAQREYRAAVDDWKLAIRPAQECPQGHEALGRLYAAGELSAMRNSTLAVKHALIAVKQVKEAHWDYFDTLAAAYAEKGDFTSALKWAQKALELAPREQRPAVGGRIQGYLQGKPYRMGRKSRFAD